MVHSVANMSTTSVTQSQVHQPHNILHVYVKNDWVKHTSLFYTPIHLEWVRLPVLDSNTRTHSVMQQLYYYDIHVVQKDLPNSTLS